MRRLLWQSMLRADMNLRYWDEAMRRYLLHEQRCRIAQLLLSSGTVAMWFIWLNADWAWKISSVVAAGLSAYLYHSGSRKLSEKYAGLRRTYASCLVLYENMWSQLEDGASEADIRPRLEALRALQYEQTADEPHLSVDNTLLKACQADVLRARRLTSEVRNG